MTLIAMDDGAKLSGLQRIVENDAEPGQDDDNGDQIATDGNDA